MTRLRYLLEYAAARGMLYLLDHMQLAASERLATRIAGFWFFLHGMRRRVAIDNIIRSGITSDPKEAQRIARDSFRHFAVLVVESLKSGECFNEKNWKDRVRVDIDPETMRLLEDPRQGIILVSGHFGNWEIAAQLLSYLKPVAGITRPMDNPYTNRLMESRKPRNRFRLIPKHDTDALRFLKILRNGEMLALLNDQHARREDPLVDFFGRPAHTHTSPALLHLVTRAPLCFGYCLRTGPMQYTVHTGPPLRFTATGNREADIRTILGALNRLLEDAIRLHPEQYLWAHRRWK